MERVKAVVASYVGVLLFAAVGFIGAGTIHYWQGWLYVALVIVGVTLSNLLLPAGSNLTAERAREASSGEAWDRRLLGLFFLITIVTLLVAGLDAGRYHWADQVPAGLVVFGAVLSVAGQLLFALAKRTNAFFSSTVRIQAEKGHRVCDTGLYGVVRHPGYLGMLLTLLAVPLVMGSYWAFVPAGVAAVLLVARTALEDRFLTEHLPGYAAYAARTPRKLIPGLF